MMIWTYLVIGFVLIATLIAFKGRLIAAFSYFRHTKPGKNSFVGIVAFPAALLVIAYVLMFVSQCAEAGVPHKAKLDYFVYTEVYGGIDHPGGQSPQCLNDGINNRITSNGGIKQNLFEYWPQRRWLIYSNVKWTHHSCAFNSDRNTYDAPGVELAFRVYW